MTALCDTPELIPVDEALAQLLEQAVTVTDTESLPLDLLCGRILAQGVPSPLDVPGFNSSAMDGFAVAHSDLNAAAPTRLPVSQRIAAGHPGSALLAGTAARIFTGAALPEGADTVIPQELCRLDNDAVIIDAEARLGQHVRLRGCHIAKGARALTAGTRLTAAHIGLAAALGIAELPVYRPLKVALLSSGDELVTPGQPLAEGQIYNANRPMLRTLLENLGCRIIDLGTLPDDFDRLRDTLSKAAADADVIIGSGGVSVGEEDHMVAVIESLGKLEMWRLAVKPGKPLAFGHVRGTPLLGLPGNPVSSLVAFCLFARPFLLRSQGVTHVAPPLYPVRADFERHKPGGRREYLRVTLEHREDGGIWAVPFAQQDSATLRSVTEADGLAVIPELATVKQGDMLAFLPFSGLFA